MKIEICGNERARTKEGQDVNHGEKMENSLTRRRVAKDRRPLFSSFIIFGISR